APARERAVRSYVERPDVLVRGVVDVEHRLVGREGQAVRQREVVDEQVEAPVGRDPVHPLKRQLLALDRLGPPPGGPRRPRRQGTYRVGRIREVDRAVGLHDDVVGAVEPLALKALGQDRACAVITDAPDTAAHPGAGRPGAGGLPPPRPVGGGGGWARWPCRWHTSPARTLPAAAASA